MRTFTVVYTVIMLFFMTSAFGDVGNRIDQVMSGDGSGDAADTQRAQAGAPEDFGDLKMERLESLSVKDMFAVKMNNGQLFFMSKNGRYVVKGELYDMWAGEEIQSMEDVAKSISTINMDSIRSELDDLSPIRVGSGDKKVIAYIGPSCDSCRDMARSIVSGVQGVEFEVFVIPKSKHQRPEAEHIACLPDDYRNRNAIEAIADGTIDQLPQKEKCNKTSYIKAALAGDHMGFNAGDIPFVIRWDGVHKPWSDNVMSEFLLVSDK